MSNKMLPLPEYPGPSGPPDSLLDASIPPLQTIRPSAPTPPTPPPPTTDRKARPLSYADVLSRPVFAEAPRELPKPVVPERTPRLPETPIVERTPPMPFLSSSDDDESQSQILIGIDFGTTYSGVAWACSGRPDDIKTVTNWQSYEYMNSDKEKAPTEICYAAEANQPTNGNEGESNNVTWGYGIASGGAVKWFKLLLLDDKDIGEEKHNSVQIRRARELLRRAGKTPVQAVADYLLFLWKHAIDSIEQELGESAVEGSPFRVVLTVPAVWTSKAVRRMRQAAIDAGILESRLAGETTLHFVSEPEAAALATFEDMKSRPNFQTGDSFVVCDAGGGTVDLISYKVHQLKPMQLRECVEGSGKLCGAVFLDQDFEELMQQMVGEGAWNNISPANVKRMMNNEWENGIKRGFDGSERTWNVTLPYDCATTTSREPVLRLSRGHVQEIFENVTSQIRALVNDQIRSVQAKEGRWPKAVVLVGGFGSCKYLFKLLRLENQDRGIEVYKSNGAKPWTAICRGAVLKALTNSDLPGITVHSRISRHSYGMIFHTKFIEGEHLEEDKYTDPLDGVVKAYNQMEWYLKKGDNIWEQDPVLMGWLRDVFQNKIPPSGMYPFSVGIYTCDLATQPTRKTKDIKLGCKIGGQLDISGLPELRGKNGQLYKRLMFDVEMTIIGMALEFTLIFQKKRMGQQNVKVEFDE